MIVDAFHTFVFTPLYNALVFLITVVPYADVGLAVIALTVIVKVILFPLAHRVAHMQVRMRALAPEVDALKEQYKDDRQQQTLKLMELYRTHKVRPFLSLLIVFIQIPIILGLYWVFFKGGLPTLDMEALYAFTPLPDMINMQFLGIVDVGGRSIILALLAGATQFVTTQYALPKPKPRGANPTFKEDLAHGFHLQMKYVMPVIVVVIAYMISAAIALYWTTSNLFAIGQELFVRWQLKRRGESNTPETSPGTNTNDTNAV